MALGHDELVSALTTRSVSRRSAMKGAAALGAAAGLAGVAGAAAAPLAGSPRLSASKAEADTLVVVLDGSPSDLDPHSAYDYRSVCAILGAYEGLIALDGSSTDAFVGKIAESWESNEDLSVWTFKIRNGVTFHDGSPCTSAEIKASFERNLTLGLGPVGVLTRFVSDISQIETPDPLTVVFNLGKPQPLFTSAMASTYSSPIVNAALLKTKEQDGDWGHGWAQTNAEGCGTGAYKLVSFEPEEQAVYERNPDYWAGWDGNHFENVVIRVVSEVSTRRQLMESGDADICDSLVPEDLDALKGNAGLVVSEDVSTQVIYFPITVAGAWESPEARLALVYAFPYEDVLEGVYQGHAVPAKGAVPEVARGFYAETPMMTTDLAMAKELLAAAGVPEGTELTAWIETGTEAPKSTVQLFQANLAELGLVLNIEEVDLTTFTAMFYGDTPAEERPTLMSWGWWPDYNDAWNHLQPQISCESWGSKGANAGFYCNDRVEELLGVAKSAATEEEYLAALAELQVIVATEDPPSIYYAQPLWSTVLQTTIEGWQFNPINIGTYDYYNLSRKA